MTNSAQQALLDQIEQLKATSPRKSMSESRSMPSPQDGHLDEMLDRLNGLTQGGGGPARNGGGDERPAQRESIAARVSKPGMLPTEPIAGAPRSQAPAQRFFPAEPRSLEEAHLTRASVEELVLKYLLATGEENGQGIATQTRLPFPLIFDLLRELKEEQLVHYRGASQLNDYTCELTELGRDRARRHSMRCTYYGAAPVSLQSYSEAVAAQSLTHQHPKEEDLVRAFSDLLIDQKMLLRLGAAVNSGRGMFLFGFPGNGKTSIAERVTRAFGETIWIPRAIGIGGEIIRIFDPSQHEEVPYEDGEDIFAERKVDRRWVQIQRPTIVVGGELTMSNLELTTNDATGINEAPVQLKSNCGTLVIDDFGRQRMSTDELLNRWIVPLEKRYDYLNLPSGTKIQVPFDQLVIFSTNLEPKDLVDDAFLRRIPYKIEVENPTEETFRKLFEIMCDSLGFKYSDKAMDYLLTKHYKKVNRPLRCCHPRDLLLQIRNLCLYTNRPLQLTPELFDFAADNYFSIV